MSKWQGSIVSLDITQQHARDQKTAISIYPHIRHIIIDTRYLPESMRRLFTRSKNDSFAPQAQLYQNGSCWIT